MSPYCLPLLILQGFIIILVILHQTSQQTRQSVNRVSIGVKATTAIFTDHSEAYLTKDPALSEGYLTKESALSEAYQDGLYFWEAGQPRGFAPRVHAGLPVGAEAPGPGEEEEGGQAGGEVQKEVPQISEKEVQTGQESEPPDHDAGESRLLAVRFNGQIGPPENRPDSTWGSHLNDRNDVIRTQLPSFVLQGGDVRNLDVRSRKFSEKLSSSRNLYDLRVEDLRDYLFKRRRRKNRTGHLWSSPRKLQRGRRGAGTTGLMVGAAATDDSGGAEDVRKLQNSLYAEIWSEQSQVTQGYKKVDDKETFASLLGSFPANVKANFHGIPEEAKLRTDSSLPDVNVLPTLMVLQCLAEAVIYGGADLPNTDNMMAAVQAVDEFHSHSYKKGNSILGVWPESLLQGYSDWVVYPANLVQAGLTSRLDTLATLVNDCEDCGTARAGLEAIQSDRLCKAHFQTTLADAMLDVATPPDLMTSFSNFALGGLLRAVRPSGAQGEAQPVFKAESDVWSHTNTDFDILLAKLKELVIVFHSSGQSSHSKTDHDSENSPNWKEFQKAPDTASHSLCGSTNDSGPDKKNCTSSDQHFHSSGNQTPLDETMSETFVDMLVDSLTSDSNSGNDSRDSNVSTSEKAREERSTSETTTESPTVGIVVGEQPPGETSEPDLPEDQSHSDTDKEEGQPDSVFDNNEDPPSRPSNNDESFPASADTESSNPTPPGHHASPSPTPYVPDTTVHSVAPTTIGTSPSRLSTTTTPPPPPPTTTTVIPTTLSPPPPTTTKPTTSTSTTPTGTLPTPPPPQPVAAATTTTPPSPTTKTTTAAVETTTTPAPMSNSTNSTSTTTTTPTTPTTATTRSPTTRGPHNTTPIASPGPATNSTTTTTTTTTTTVPAATTTTPPPPTTTKTTTTTPTSTTPPPTSTNKPTKPPSTTRTTTTTTKPTKPPSTTPPTTTTKPTKPPTTTTKPTKPPSTTPPTTTTKPTKPPSSTTPPPTTTTKPTKPPSTTPPPTTTTKPTLPPPTTPPPTTPPPTTPPPTTTPPTATPPTTTPPTATPPTTTPPPPPTAKPTAPPPKKPPRTNQILDSRAYYSLETYLSSSFNQSGPDIVLLPLWISDNTTRVAVTSDRSVGVQTPSGDLVHNGVPYRQYNWVDPTTTATTLHALVLAVLAGMVDTRQHPDIQTVVSSSLGMLTWLMSHPAQLDMALALSRFPSRYQFFWMAGRIAFQLQSSQAVTSGAFEFAQAETQQFLASAQSTMTLTILDSIVDAGLASDGKTRVYVDDLLGIADLDSKGKPKASGDDRLFASSMAVNALLSTWTTQKPDGRLQFLPATKDAVKIAVTSLVNYVASGLRDKTLRQDNVFMAEMVKDCDSLSAWYPFNTRTSPEGQPVTSDQPGRADRFGVSGQVGDHQYQAQLEAPAFPHPLPRQARDLFTRGDSLFWLWTSPAYTKAAALLATALASRVD